MKKCFALLLTALLCLSLVACGEKAPEDDGGDEQQENNNQQPTLEELLCTGEWYYVGLKTPAGLVFDDDGTISGGTWTLDGTTLDCTWKNGTTSRFAIRNISDAYFMTDEEGLTLYHGQTKPNWHALGYIECQVVTHAWEDHLEVACVDGEYRLQLKKQYMQALIVGSDFDSYVDICYSQGDKQNEQKRLTFDFDSYYIPIENPAEFPLEIVEANGVLCVLTDLM